MTPAPALPTLRPRIAALLGVLLMLAPAPAAAAGTDQAHAQAALDWLAPRLDASLAPVVAEAAHAAGLPLGGWPRGDPVAARLELPAGDGVLMPLLRPAHALALAFGSGPSSGRDEVGRRLGAHFDGTQFGDPALANDDAWALRALAAWDLRPTERAAAAAWLAQQQDPSGGWAWRVGGEPDVDTTGMVVVALAEAGALPAEAEARALAWLAGFEAPWGTEPGAPANCDSIVWGLRAFGGGRAARHADPARAQAAVDAAWRSLASLRRADGSVGYLDAASPNALCTAEAATAWALADRGDLPACSTCASAEPEREAAGAGAAGLLGALAIVAAAATRPATGRAAAPKPHAGSPMTRPRGAAAALLAAPSPRRGGEEVAGKVQALDRA